MKTLLILAGIGQLLLAAGSLAIPRVLRWKEDTAKLVPLTRQVFWTYAAYIWVTNICFGLISTFGAELLLDSSMLARLVCTFMAAYWAGRVGVQFFYFDRTCAPSGPLFVYAEVALILLFVYLTAIYAWVALATGGN
jgi:hypothetical protein